jgi:hypothetical protein
MVATVALVLPAVNYRFLRASSLVAMCKQSKGQKICHLVRLRSYWGQSATQVDRAMEIPSLRAA